MLGDQAQRRLSCFGAASSLSHRDAREKGGGPPGLTARNPMKRGSLLRVLGATRRQRRACYRDGEIPMIRSRKHRENPARSDVNAGSSTLRVICEQAEKS